MLIQDSLSVLQNVDFRTAVLRNAVLLYCYVLSINDENCTNDTE